MFQLTLYWADTGTRGGLGRAFRNSIFAKRCDVFLGLSDNGEDDQLPDRLTFTKPYISLGYVLVVQGKAAIARPSTVLMMYASLGPAFLSAGRAPLIASTIESENQ